MQKILLGCNFVSTKMFTFDMQQNSTVRLMGLVDRIMQKNSLLKAIICCESAIFEMARYTLILTIPGAFLSAKHISFKRMTK